MKKIIIGLLLIPAAAFGGVDWEYLFKVMCYRRVTRTAHFFEQQLNPSRPTKNHLPKNMLPEMPTYKKLLDEKNKTDSKKK